jgi:hypothetical protein
MQGVEASGGCRAGPATLGVAGLLHAVKAASGFYDLFFVFV